MCSPDQHVQTFLIIGHFPLPGQLTKLAGGTAPPGMMASNSALFGTLDMPLRLQQNKLLQGGVGSQNATLIRQAKRLYVGNIPFGIQEVSCILNNHLLHGTDNSWHIEYHS
jgi:splicing factor U2AF subunit